MILTALAGAIAELPAVQLSTTAAAEPCSVDITREPAGAAGALVRGSSRHLDTGGALALTDLEAPFGVEVTYTLTIRPDSDPSSSTQVTATVTTGAIDAGAVFSDSFTGLWVDVTVVDETSRQASQASAIYWPAGAPRPVVHRVTARRWLLSLDVIVDTAPRRDRLDALLVSGEPVLIRYPPGVALTAGWVQPVRDVNVTRPNLDGTSPMARYSFQASTIDTPDPSVEATATTLADLHDLDPTTLDSLSAHAATLLELTQWAQAGVLDNAGP